MKLVPDTGLHIDILNPLAPPTIQTDYDHGTIDMEDTLYSVKDFIDYMKDNSENLFNKRNYIILEFVNGVDTSDDLQYICQIYKNKKVKTIRSIFNSYPVLPIDYKYIKKYVLLTDYNIENDNLVKITCWITSNKNKAIHHIKHDQFMRKISEPTVDTSFKKKLEGIL